MAELILHPNAKLPQAIVVDNATIAVIALGQLRASVAACASLPMEEITNAHSLCAIVHCQRVLEAVRKDIESRMA